ncbi:MAG: alpha-L-glutamate ligase [Planococcus sp. (in: firmicutes)]|uniref:ATP-grasp domain-containing protein n=1 Tax=Planococcus halocryophilus TaxID=1215089 RepID=UPI001F0D2D7D|nr:alpha-L-glutamate ligase [Planococcus halocryophilus]MCH4825613.1 alpha-L-glutamate ligase [Planococcus halocryophilus]
MKLLYETQDAKRNRGFIAELQRFGDFDLIEWDDWSDEGLTRLADNLAGELVVFRARRPKAARFLEDQGIHLVNRAEVNRIANDKWKSFELFMLLGVPTIPSYRQAPEYPCVVKTMDGHGGDEVWLLQSAEDIPNTNSSLLFQPVVAHQADIRVFVIGTEIVGAVKRISNDSFKANYSLGASIEKYVLTAAQEKDVLRISRAINSDYVGIDFLLLEDGRHVFNEIEDPVGARSFYETHVENIAELFLEHIRKMGKHAPFQREDRLK